MTTDRDTLMRTASVSHQKQTMNWRHKDFGDVYCTASELVLRYNLLDYQVAKLLAATKSSVDGWVLIR